MCQVVEQNGEFVAAQAGQHVALAQTRLEPPRDPDEQLVAHQVTQTVVDHLEPIDVQEQDREQVLWMALAAVENLAEELHEERPVGQRGQRVVQCCVAQLLLGGDPLGHVCLRTRDPGRTPVGPTHGNAAAQHPTIGAVLVADAVLMLEVGSLTSHMRFECRIERRQVVGMDPPEPIFWAPHRLAGSQTEHALPAS